ncbi:phosphatase PAP2 family protein [Sphingomonas sp.]|jgi:membrane-associated phospholipid phosphatase|uniref:phosphatase PAP2 family protein n=1 Tax=Sphingomonas sp. TaxID=28214 RepID=UPI002DF45CF2|nr:phosphatase PAP2 family protein [Sphingomonas sp.]
MRDEARPLERASWLLIAAMLALFIALQLRSPFALAPLGLAVATLTLGLLACGWRRTAGRGQSCAAAGAVALIQMTLFTLLGVAITYMLTAQAGALWDEHFAQADRALGLNWPAVRAVLDKRPLVVTALGFSYHSLALQMVAAICALSAAGRLDILRITVFAALSSGLLTVLLSGLFPANGNIFEPADYRHLWPSIPWQQIELLHGLRSGAIRTIDLLQLEGIVTFPSYHATLSVLFAWSFRSVPGLRIAGPVWASLTLLATPIFGGHYMVDVLAGALLGIVSLVAGIGLASDRYAATMPRQRLSI